MRIALFEACLQLQQVARRYGSGGTGTGGKSMMAAAAAIRIRRSQEVLESEAVSADGSRVVRCTTKCEVIKPLA
jgi:hypothetical protein